MTLLLTVASDGFCRQKSPKSQAKKCYNLDKLLENIEPQFIAGQFKALRSAVRDFSIDIERDFPKLLVFRVIPKRGYDTRILIEHGDSCLSQESNAIFSKHLRDNWREATRCIALNAPTAAAFHMLRVTEEMIRKYHKALIGKDAPASGKVGLAEYIKGLRGKARKEVITALTQLRVVHRNPTMHPGPIVNLNKALSMFGLCISVIDEIAADMNRSPSGTL